jgi:hypothetical protein
MLHTLIENMAARRAHLKAHVHVQARKDEQHAGLVSEADAKAARTGWEPRAEEVEDVFYRVAQGDGTHIDKNELCDAHHGDFGFFDGLDADADGKVTIVEWTDHLLDIHTQKQADRIGLGDQWLDGVLHALGENSKHRQQVHRFLQGLPSSATNSDQGSSVGSNIRPSTNRSRGTTCSSASIGPRAWHDGLSPRSLGQYLLVAAESDLPAPAAHLLLGNTAPNATHWNPLGIAWTPVSALCCFVFYDFSLSPAIHLILPTLHHEIGLV